MATENSLRQLKAHSTLQQFTEIKMEQFLTIFKKKVNNNIIRKYQICLSCYIISFLYALPSSKGTNMYPSMKLLDSISLTFFIHVVACRNTIQIIPAFLNLCFSQLLPRKYLLCKNPCYKVGPAALKRMIMLLYCTPHILTSS